MNSKQEFFKNPIDGKIRSRQQWEAIFHNCGIEWSDVQLEPVDEPQESTGSRNTGKSIGSLEKANRYLSEQTDNGLRLYKAASYFYFIGDGGNVPESIYTRSIKNVTVKDLDEAVKKYRGVK